MDVITSLEIIRACYPTAKKSMTMKQIRAVNREYHTAITWLQSCGVELPKELIPCTPQEKQL